MSSKRISSMSRLACAAALLAAISALGGCAATSITPAVDRKDRVVDDRLQGTWHGDGKELAVIEARDSEYSVVYTDKDGQRAPLVGRLGRLADRWILDLSADRSTLQGGDAFKSLLLPLHTFLVLDSLGTRTAASLVKPDSLKAYLARNPTALAHLTVEGDVLLTAPTAELRAFLERYLARPGVLEPEVWRRR